MQRLNFKLKDVQLMCHASAKYAGSNFFSDGTNLKNIAVLMAMRTYAPYGGSTLIKRTLIALFVVCKIPMDAII